MSLKTFVKVSGVNNLSDARYCAGMGVDVLGFHLDPLSDAYIPPEKFNAIREWISGIALAGEFSLSSAPAIIEHLNNFSNLDYLQIENPADISLLLSLNLPIILPVDVTKFNNAEDLKAYLNQYQKDIAYFLLTSSGEISTPSFLKEIVKLSEKFPIILGFGINAENVNSLIDQTSLAGIALQGGDEIRPGYRNFDELADILEAIEVEEY